MKGNFSVLDSTQLDVFNNRFVFKQVDDGVLVTTRDYNRTVFHGFSDSFPAIAKIDDRKITLRITPKAMEIWRRPDVQQNHSLVDVQNVINSILVSSQQISDEDILKKLN